MQGIPNLSEPEALAKMDFLENPSLTLQALKSFEFTAPG
jgi:hypothetical protein